MDFVNNKLTWLAFVWNGGSSALSFAFFPWRLPPGISSDRVRGFYIGGLASNAEQYAPEVTLMGTQDRARFRVFNGTSLNLPETSPSRVIGAVCVLGANSGGTSGSGPANVLAATDVETTAIGASWMHPVASGTCTTTAGTAYISGLSSTVPVFATMVAHGAATVRITAGADRGMYQARNLDRTNGRLYLANLDGTPFVAQASATLVAVSFGTRLAWFNETNVLNNGVGQITLEGRYTPGEARESYICRVRIERTGTIAADYTQGSYWFSLRPWRYGDGVYGASTGAHGTTDSAMLTNQRVDLVSRAAESSGIFDGTPAGFVGGCPGLVLTRSTQYLWGNATDGTNGAIWRWRYKSPETLRTVATSSGTANDPIPAVDMGTARPVDLDRGTDDTVYVALTGVADGGWVAIAPNDTVTRVRASTLGFPGGSVAGIAVDRGATRSSVPGTLTTTAGTNIVTVSGMNFSARDRERHIDLVGVGNDSGSYHIQDVVGADTVAVRNPNGAPTVFSGGSGGNASIPDTIYLFFNDATTNVNTVRYFVASNFGVLHTVNVAMTGGATITGGARPGDVPARTVDQETGVLYWASSDGGQQLNRFDLATTTWTRRVVSDFAGLNGGLGTITSPTVFLALAVNPHASFRELWVATDQGHVRLDVNAFAGAFKRYFGSGMEATPYSQGGFARPDGSFPTNGNSRRFQGYAFGPDGRVFSLTYGSNTANAEVVQYTREGDFWTTGVMPDNQVAFGNATFGWTMLADGYGCLVMAMPFNKDGGVSTPGIRLLSHEIHYQWVNSVWTPREVVRGALPDTTFFPGCASRPLHTTSEPLVMGVRVRFTAQGGATPHVNEFLGRAAQVSAVRTDGSTTAGSANFGGTGFAATDAGKLLHLILGGDTGVYRISAYISANLVTLRRLNGTNFSATGTAGALSYALWEDQANPGPECCTAYLANGLGKDNKSDLLGGTHEFFFQRTVPYVQAEGVKVCLPPVGPQGSAGPQVYWESFPRETANNYAPGLPQHRALPTTPLANGTQLLTGAIDGLADGTLGRPNTTAVPTWGGRSAAANGTTGYALTVDLGANADVGAVVVRFQGNVANNVPQLNTETANIAGLIATLHSVEGDAPPVASTSVRTSGISGLNMAVNDAMVTLTSGDFLGSLTTSTALASTQAGTSTIFGPAGFFVTAYVGQVARILTGADAGAYRILAVADDGTNSSCTVRNLDQSAKVFSATSSGLSVEVRDAVRAEDMLMVPSGGVHQLCVERLLSPTTAQVRVLPAVSLTGQSWQAIRPTWRLTKRISHSVQAVPPDVANNGTYVSRDGRESNDDQDFKIVIDLSDLDLTQRAGRYWRFAAMPRFTVNAAAPHQVTSIQFFDSAGVLLGVAPDARLAATTDYASFIAARVTRVDYLQATDTACAHVTNVNGLAAVGGPSGNVVTLGGRRFLGYQTGAGSAGSAPGANALFNAGVGDPSFNDGDVGRTLRIVSGANAGYYRVASRLSATQVSLTTPAGNPVTLTAGAAIAYALHEGIQGGSTAPDWIAFTTGGNTAAVVEYQVASLSDDMATLTLVGFQGLALTGQNWEIRRRAVAPTVNATTTDPNVTARLLFSGTSAPLQAGDVCQDSRGSLEFHPNDVGVGPTRTDGTCVAGSATFTGTGFTPDDVGRALVVEGGPNRGTYRIATFVSATEVTVRNLFTGATQLFLTTANAQSYHKRGRRRFRASRYVVVLRA